MSYCDYSASIPQTSPFKLYSQTSFGSDLKIGQPTHFQPNLLQQQQQALQAGHLKQQLCLKLQHSGSQQLQRLRVTWSLIWGALLVAAVVAVLLAFTPLGWPVLPHQHQSWSSSQTTVQHTAAAMAPAAGMIKCRVQQGSSAVSSLCDGDVLYDDGMQAHITVWHQTAAAAGPSQPGSVSGAAAGSLTSSADGAWDAVSVFGRHRRRQQHRKLVRFV